MSPDDCREARELLQWSQRDLAAAADVPLWFVVAFEDGDSPAFLAHYEIALREALEAVGIGFPFEIEDGQIDPAGVTYSPRDNDGLNQVPRRFRGMLVRGTRHGVQLVQEEKAGNRSVSHRGSSLRDRRWLWGIS
ncbi:MAG: hypothetical protein ABSC25_05540 [Roseiarcus sp.]|jgi:hypothetical protein